MSHLIFFYLNNRSGGNCSEWELSGLRVVRGENCPGWKLSGVGILRRLDLLSGKSQGGSVVQWEFPGGNCLVGVVLLGVVLAEVVQLGVVRVGVVLLP